MNYFRKQYFPLIALSAILFTFFSAYAQDELPNSTIKTIYIVPTSHYDFGFVEPPDQVRERAARHIDEVLRVAKKYPNFRWTIESTWQINEWLKRQQKPTSVLPKDKERINALMDLIKSGRVALSTSWGSMHTDFMGEEELNRINYDYAKLSRSYGVKSDFAMMDDVPGHPTSIPNVLAGGGTKYLVVGANLFIRESTSLAPGKVPFYWESPDGSRVLTWVSQGTRGGYVEALTDYYLDPYSLDPYTDKTPFEMFNPELAEKKTPLEIMEIGVTELLNRYNKAGYKFDSVMAIYAHDFIEPTYVQNLDKAVTLWNSNHSEVRLKISTPEEFLTQIEAKYKNQIETHRGEWSGLWSEAKTQSPRISALARYSHDNTPAIETLWSALALERTFPYPVGNFSRLYDQMMTYDEHSGAGNNGWIQLNASEKLAEQNRQYVRDMKSSKREIDRMYRQGINLIAQPNRYDQQSLQPENTSNLVVYNPLSFSRNDVVLKKLKPGQTVTGVIDQATNKTIAFEIDYKNRLSFVAKSVPSMGYKSYRIIMAGSKKKIDKSNFKDGNEIANQYFRVTAAPNGAIASIFDKRNNRELVNPNGEVPFNQLLRVEGSEASRINSPFTPKFSTSKNSVASRLYIKRKASAFPLTIITIYNDIPRIEIHNELSEDLPFVGGNNNWHDSYYFAFPFAIDKDGLKIKRGGQKWFDTLPDDYLPGARNDAVTTQHLIGLTDGNATALIAHRQSFHWLFAGFVDSKMLKKGAPKAFPAMFTGKFPLPEATIYSRAIRKSNQADTHDIGVENMPTVEPGMHGNYVFEYAIEGGNAFNEVSAWEFGSSFNVPLRAEFVTTLPNELAKSYFSVDKPNVQIVTVKTLSDSVIRGEVSAAPLDPEIKKQYVIRLQEFSGIATQVLVSLPVKIKSAALLNLTESEVLKKLDITSGIKVRLKPFETKTIRFEIEK